MSCTEFTSLVFYDPWVVPHQLLPAIAIVLGIEWKMVLVLVYAWETVEFTFLKCLDLATPESGQDSLISDPIQGLIGILVGFMLLNVTNNGKPLFSSQYRAFFWAALFAAPSLILIADDDYVWFYVPMWFVATFLLHKVGTTLSPPLMVYLVMYATLVSVMVFSLKEEFNSFYTALSAATFVVFFVLVIRNFAYY